MNFFLGYGRSMRSGEECCKSKGVPRLCLGFCVREQKKYESLQRSTQCYEFRGKMETCLEGNVKRINSWCLGPPGFIDNLYSI